MKQQNYGFQLGTPIIVLLFIVFIPLALMGALTAAAFAKFLFSSSNAIPIWAILAVGALAIFIMRR